MTLNPHLDAFMNQFPFMALTYDDVSLTTQYADFLPIETSLTTRLSRNIELTIPFVSAAMDTVTESAMAIAMARCGGIGIIHKNLSPHDQRSEIKRVKLYLNGFLTKARTVFPEQTLGNLFEMKREKKWSFNSFPVVDELRHLIGIITSREIKYCDDLNQKLGDLMMATPVTAKLGTTIKEAYDLMMRHRISILPVVDGSNIFQGMYCFNDVKEILTASTPFYNRDAAHSLRCGAAVGPQDYERIEILMETNVDVLVVDTAHGYSKGVLDAIAWVKKTFPHVDVIGGNVATEAGAQAMIDAGADAVKVGVGPGSICTTRVIAGVGVPQLSAIYSCARAARKAGIPIIADGGIRYSGDVAKALVAGADAVMMGGVLAGTDESPGQRMLIQGRQYVLYRGMGSLEAMEQRFGSADRYGQAGQQKLVPEGVEGMVPYTGPLSDVLDQFVGGLRSSLGYNGSRTIPELQAKGEFVRVSQAGRVESHPHDIMMTKDAPNYKMGDM